MTTATLLRLIGSSADSAVTLSRIAELAGCSRREVEQAVQAARLDGHGLITSTRGVWLSNDGGEVLRAAEALSARLVTQYQTVRAMRRTGRRMQSVEYHQEGMPWAA